MPLFDQYSRMDLRRMYVEAWRKHGRREPLEPLQQQIVAVIADHPEYQALLEAPDALEAEFPPELGASNPFLHMGLHIAVREQVNTDRPAGIAALHSRLSSRLGSSLEAEHAMLEVLAETIWAAQRSPSAAPPDPADYLERLRALAGPRG